MKTIDKTKAVAGYYWRHALKYPRSVTGLFLSIPLTILVNNFLPTLIVANVLSKLSQHHYSGHNVWANFGPQLVGYAALIVSGMVTWRLVDYFSWHIEGNIQRDIAEEIFTKLLHQTADFHANQFAGSLVSHANKLLGGYIRVADTTVYQAFPLLCSLVFASIIMFNRSLIFVVLLISFALIYLIGALFASRPARRRSQEFALAESEQTGFLADALTNNLAIKSFAGGDYEYVRYQKATNNTHRKLGSFARAHQLQITYLGFSNRVILAMSLTVAVISVMLGNANIATMFLILSYTANIAEGLFQFGNNSLRNYNRAFGDASEMVALLALKPKVQDPELPEPSHFRAGAIKFVNVGFKHDGADTAIFTKLNLNIKPGEKVGLVGHSGSGKTTFTRLLLRFSDIQQGEILIDGQNISAVTQDDLHRAIAYVPQEPLLFHRTIGENIGYGNFETSEQAVEGVAKLAHAHDFIQDLPQGYETLVGERGVKLSGGQRQRVAIARAMLKNAPILLLDEATSALDSESEALIQDALWKLMEGRTAIVIAHRLSTIQKMDRIIVLNNGKVVEQGSHKELIRSGGTYASLWSRQSGGFLDD